jgi:hypothetical protein
MKILIIAAIFSAALWPFQESAANPDLIVLKFNYGTQDTGSHMIRPVSDPDPPMNEPIRVTQQKKDEPQEVKNRRDLQERRAEMQATEVNAALSKQKTTTIYFYHLEIKNAGEKIVKSFAWSYQPGEIPDPSDRQFFCVVNVKPNANRNFDLYTPLSPSRVVDARTRKGPEKDEHARVMINQIEYTDGTVWKRQAWNPKTFSREATDKVAIGKCIGL